MLQNYLKLKQCPNIQAIFLQKINESLNGSAAFIVMDNLRIHHTKLAQVTLKTMPNLTLVFLPAYSCALNPIEKAWSVIK